MSSLSGGSGSYSSDPLAAVRAMRVCYADPPYPGQGRRYKCAEMDHAELIARLVRDYPDGWALSTSSPALRDILPLCPPKARVMAWCKPFVPMRPTVPVAYAWEPVIVMGGRKRPRSRRSMMDWLLAGNEQSPLIPGFTGAKPAAFCFWLFNVLGLEPTDEFDDLFHGTGAVKLAWSYFCRQGVLL